MLCDVQRIINEIQNASRAISLQASGNHTQNISKSQEILNEILKLDFDCDTAPISNTLNLINNNLNYQINPTLNSINNNVIDVKSTVITANQNILSVKSELSLVSQRIINLINSISQISVAINSLNASILNIQSTVNSIKSSIFTLNNLIANIQTNLSLVLNATANIQTNVNLVLNLTTTIDLNVKNIKQCCEDIKDLLEEEPLPPPEFDFIDIICIDCTDPDGPDCPPDATPEEKERGYREREITLDDPMEALQLLNDQVALLQRKICPADDQDCMVLLPDPSLPLTTRGHYLLFCWVLEENPKVSVYQNHTQLRNPIDALRVAGNHWEQYFKPIYKILGKQFGSYFSEQPAKRPLIEGWFLDVAEANRFFNQMKALTKDTPRENNNPRFPMVTNSTVPIVNVGKKLILNKVCYGFYDEGNFTKVHSWHRPKNV
jgi:predicted  nucleic acid-binding Zn-ribbon protein